ncbi:MAG TPA: imidazole glycerol phosphate synthase subunit HisH [Rhodothermales bacterium]|nr:imidazole glycerol phosphate synthase subunit HisH [Bacteroidota bacterium]HRK74551.1 imidazole glycerol phosphate synthase subunit HisH [Rhodothermales bacterium]HRR08693.1 imidazole glycerol phosphate synthase subunit HisH [Rhodothermales bacterium]
MKVALIKYNAGNIVSVVNALNRLGVEPVWTNDPEQIQTADCVIFPGVGEARASMQSVQENGIDILLPTLKQPVLGICVGLQLMCRHSEENNTPCLGIFDVAVRKFPAGSEKVPQNGWNSIHKLHSPLFSGIKEGAYVYYNNSFYAEKHVEAIATTHYALPFSGALHHENFYAVQFHPEKSGDVGAEILQNFLSLSW